MPKKNKLHVFNFLDPSVVAKQVLLYKIQLQLQYTSSNIYVAVPNISETMCNMDSENERKSNNLQRKERPHLH
jgi:hypothetical protein